MTPQRARQLAAGVVAGDRRALARLITHVENQEDGAETALAHLFPRTGRTHLVGITGPPGAGKSTLTDKLIREARGRGRSVGVICVDPSSPFSGGAILGDRIRMQEHASDDQVFIRSIGTRGGPGGLSRTTQESCMLLDAAGFDLVILETAGVGQTELGVLEVAHTILVVLVPESGDDIQMMKAGILEIADILAVNKCDRPASDQIVRELRAMLEIALQSQPWRIPVLKTIADKGEGVKEVFEAVEEHHRWLKESGTLSHRSARFARAAIVNFARDMAAQTALALLEEKRGAVLLDAVASRRMDPFTAARKLLSRR
ncbi:MAG: methylmalonyl Co-A mutase-associated GTPase MeaB [Bdellovibrionales bacterium]|nr:methylmalonyl Co-A mutase-associated GTPase MeaB [Bdellovibrionales bacterium]